MADNNLKVGAEFDVGPIVSGAQKATDAFKQLGSAVEQQAAKFAAQGVTAEDNIKILTGLGYTAKDAAAAVAALGGAEAEEAVASKAAAAATESFGKQVTYLSSRVAFMESGLGMLGYPMARLASYLPGLAPLWEIALPFALVAAFIPEIEKMGRASLELADAVHAVSESSAKQNDELMKLDEEYTRITSGPIAAYEKELRDIPLLSLDLSNETKVLTKELEAESTAWTYLAGEAQHFIIVAAAIGTLGLAGTTKHMTEFAYSAKDAEKAIEIINDKVLENKDVSAAINGINMEIAKAQKYQNDEKEAGRVLDAVRTQQAIDALNVEKQYLETQQKITAEKARNTQAEAAKAVTEEAARQIAAQEKLQETISKTAAVQAEAAAQASLETVKGLPELSLPEIDAKKKAVSDAIDAERDEELSAADQIYQIKVAADDKEIALYHAGTEEYRKAVAKKAQDEADYDLQIVEINRSMDEKKNESNREYENKYREMMIRQADDAEKAAQRMAELEIEQNKRAQEQITADQKHALDLRMAELKAATTGLSAGPLTEALKDQFNDAQLKAYGTELSRLNDELARTVIIEASLGAKLAGGGILTPEEVERLKQATQQIGQLQNQIGQLKIKQIELQATMINSWQEIERAMQNAVNTGFSTFNQNIIKMMQTGQYFSQTMINVWNSMVESFVVAVLKMGENWIATEFLKLETTQTTNAAVTASTLETNIVQRLDNAKTAASKAMASTPFPLDLIVGPLVFAAALAFKEGGIVPGDQMIYAHDQEMVLPRPISSAIQGAVPAIQNFNSFMNSAAPATTGGGGGNSHVTHNHRTNITVNQSGGKMSVDEITAAVKKGMRSGSLDMVRSL